MFTRLLKICIFLDKLPFSIRVLLESAVRNCDNFQVLPKDVENILNWNTLRGNAEASRDMEVSFKPARVILQVILSTIIYPTGFDYY